MPRSVLRIVTDKNERFYGQNNSSGANFTAKAECFLSDICSTSRRKEVQSAVICCSLASVVADRRKSNSYKRLHLLKMAAKRVLQDPEYEAIPAKIQEKRIKLIEDNVRKQTKKKIEDIMTAHFNQEMNSKGAEIDCVDEGVSEVCSTLDRLRACAVTKYYANVGQEQTSSENIFPSIHPTVKKYLGKSPKYLNSDQMNSNSVESSQSTGESSSETSFRLTSSKPHPSNESSKKTEVVTKSYPSPSKDISSRAPRFKIKSKIIIGNISKFIPIWQRDDQNTHKWMIYVRGDKNDQDIESYIQKVKFLLHYTYKPNDVVEVCNSPFHLVKRGWGEFPVRVQVFFHDPRNKTVDILHTLKLDKTYSGLQTLGSETVVDVQLFKPVNCCNTSFSALPSISSLSSSLNSHDNHESYNGSNSNSTISVKMELDIDSEASIDVSSTDNLLSSVSVQNVTSEKLFNRNSLETVSNIIVPNGNPSFITATNVPNEHSSSISEMDGPSEDSSCIPVNDTPNGSLSCGIVADVPNRTTISKLVVPNTSLSNNTDHEIKSVNNTVPNGVNTTYLKCTDKEGRVLLVPQSSLVRIKSQKLMAKPSTNSTTQTTPVDKPEKILNSQNPLPSYILKVVPNQDSGKNQVLLIPMAEKTVQCTDVKTSAEAACQSDLAPNSLSEDKSNLMSMTDASKKPKPGDFGEQELSSIKIEYYKSFVDLLKRVCKAIPLVKEGVDRNIYPFCASSLEEFLRWNIGKQRASEWRRAGLVRTAILNILKRNKFPSTTEESVWPRHSIMSWCRKNGFVPMSSEKMTLLPEPKWSGVELCSVTHANDLLSSLPEEDCSKLDSVEDDVEIEIVGNSDAMPSKAKNNQSQQPYTHTPYLNPASAFVKETASQIGVNIKPVEMEPSVFVPAVEEMILAACRELATDILRSSVSAGYDRMGGQLCPEEITVSDVYSAIKDTPQFDFLTNSYLGVPKETRGDT